MVWRLVTVTVTVTKALVWHPLLEDRGHITESIRILVPVDKMKQVTTYKGIMYCYYHLLL